MYYAVPTLLHPPPHTFFRLNTIHLTEAEVIILRRLVLDLSGDLELNEAKKGFTGFLLFGYSRGTGAQVQGAG